MFLGIDLGTSGVKAVLAGERQDIVATGSAPLETRRPRPLWSEQDPEDWWRAMCRAVAAIRRANPGELAAVKGIGLSGQMHGATLLDSRDRVLRPAILWNDGRCAAECDVLEAREPASRRITGNLAMPGFTAPKLIWVARHEPEVFSEDGRGAAAQGLRAPSHDRRARVRHVRRVRDPVAGRRGPRLVRLHARRDAAVARQHAPPRGGKRARRLAPGHGRGRMGRARRRAGGRRRGGQPRGGGRDRRRRAGLGIRDARPRRGPCSSRAPRSRRIRNRRCTRSVTASRIRGTRWAPS